MTNAAIQVARAISAMVPTKPKTTLLGGAARRQEAIAYGAAMSAAVAAWQYAAGVALVAATDAAPEGWVVDADNHDFIKGVRELSALEAMCDPAYPWSGRRADQV